MRHLSERLRHLFRRKTAHAEYNKTTKELRFVMDDQTPADDDNTIVVKLLDQKKNDRWFNNT